MEPAHATTKASRSRCMDAVHIRNLLMLQLKQQEVVAWINSYMEHAHATTKASRSRCMDLIHI